MGSKAEKTIVACKQGAHLAVTSFLDGACPRALAAGINLTLRAETTAVLSRAGMLAVVRAMTVI